MMYLIHVFIYLFKVNLFNKDIFGNKSWYGNKIHKQSVGFIYLRKKMASSVGGNHRDPVLMNNYEMFPEAVGSSEKPACKFSQRIQSASAAEYNCTKHTSVF